MPVLNLRGKKKTKYTILYYPYIFILVPLINATFHVFVMINV